MPSVNIRIGAASRDALKAISREDGCSIHQAADRAVEVYRRQRMLEQTNRAYSALKADPKAWAEELDEHATWDAASSESGKTILGLEVFRRLGRPAVILSPTITIRDGWLARLGDFL